MAPKDLVNICAILLIVFTGVTFYQRVAMERRVARKSSSAHFERVYNKAQDEIAEWRRKYDAEIAARAVECDTNMTRRMQQQLSVTSARLASAVADNQKLVDEIVKLNAHLTRAGESHVDVAVDMRKLEELSKRKELTVRDR